MADIRCAFWNLQNLFDTTASKIAADLEFTPEAGWTDAALDAKVEALLDVIETLFDGQGLDLLGICEIETEALVDRLTQGINARLGRTDLVFATDQAADIRGIDCSLIYSSDVFEPAGDPVGHLVHLRFPTRDIFEVPLRVKATGAELVVFVSHWPSRRQGARESEPYRITVASHMGRLVDDHLKLNRTEVEEAPDLAALFPRMQQAFDRNVLIMGDLNDDPFNYSVLEELRSTNSLDLIEEELPAPRGETGSIVNGRIRKSDLETYLRRQSTLFNMSWGPLGVSGEGTIHFSRNTVRTKQVFDQIIVSRGLLLGRQGLQMSPDDVAIHTPRLMWTNSRLPDNAERHKVRPRTFDRNTLRGSSDHFPVTAVIREVAMA